MLQIINLVNVFSVEINVKKIIQKQRSLTYLCSLREKFPYSKVFWSVFGPNSGIYGPENLKIQTLFTQW